MSRPAKRYPAVVDLDVGMMVDALGQLGDAVDERKRLREVGELELPHERPVELGPAVRNVHALEYARSGRRPDPGSKRKVASERLCEDVFRPLAGLVVRVLLPLRTPPPAVVLAGAATGLSAAIAIVDGKLLLGAVLLQLKTVLDNADGQLARASGRVTELGRYLDSEADLLVNTALFLALGYRTGEPWLALAAFLALTFVLSANFNLERLYRQARGEAAGPASRARGLTGILGRIYRWVYAPQDRLLERTAEWRLERLRAGAAGRLVYHDKATLAVVANFGLTTQLAALGLALAVGRPGLYFFVPLGCLLVLGALALRRERRVRSISQAAAANPSACPRIEEAA